jgi:hypothetical protein
MMRFAELGAGLTALVAVMVYVVGMMFATHRAGMSGSPLTAVAGAGPSYVTLLIAVVAVVVGGTIICRTLVP